MKETYRSKYRQKKKSNKQAKELLPGMHFPPSPMQLLLLLHISQPRQAHPQGSLSPLLPPYARWRSLVTRHTAQHGAGVTTLLGLSL